MAVSRAVIHLGRFLGEAAAPASSAALQFSTAGGVASYKLPDLPYSYSALEPYISGEIMELHHKKHHATYVANVNKALEQLADAEDKRDLSKMIALQSTINFNGGGHINHDIFWTNLAPAKDYEPPSDKLMEAITDQFESYDDFKATFNTKAAAVQGSGWCWLGYNRDHKRLEIATTANQDPLMPHKGLVPLLGCDDLQYKNVRPEYLKNYWQVVNWKNVEDRWQDAKD